MVMCTLEMQEQGNQPNNSPICSFQTLFARNVYLCMFALSEHVNVTSIKA